MSKNIKISKKHGLNPSLILCPCCGESSGVAICGKLKNDIEAPRQMLDQNPCERCEEKFTDFKKKGFVLFICRDDYPEDGSSPWPYFHSLNVIKESAAKNIFKNVDLSKGAAFIPVKVAEMIGLELDSKEKL